MADIHDIVIFSVGGEKILGVVVEHYTNPLDDFSIVYADYALYKSYSSDKDAIIVIDNVIIPACDAALAEYRLKRQHLRDIEKFHGEMNALRDAIKSHMETDDIFKDDTI